MFSFKISFEKLKEWVDSQPNQIDGAPKSRSETGEPYIVFACAGLARGGDEETIESLVANQMQYLLRGYFERPGTIYWRERLEFYVRKSPQFVRFDDSGPDIDFATDRRCILDHNWTGFRAYCRVLKSDRPVLEKVS